MVVPVTGAARDLYVAVEGSDLNVGSEALPLASLQAALDQVDIAAHGDHTIFVRGGTYYGQTVNWKKHSPDHRITISAYPNETVIFDGIRNGEIQTLFFALSRGTGVDSNVTIRGLTVRNYLSWAVFIGYGGDWLGGNVIEDNIFYNIGDRFLPPGKSCNLEQAGFAVVALEETGGNLIQNNVFAHAENCPMNARLMHAVYLQHGASGNEISANRVYWSSGDPFKVRNGSSDNVIVDNYALYSGDHAFLLSCSEANEAPSWRNAVADNRIAYPYAPGGRLDVTTNCNSSPTTFIDRGQALFLAAEGASP